MQIRDAERILRDERASRGYSSCFVNPNAKCPVCKETVFYYQNGRGSRVFFDDLGPPWPKHGCTDNPRLAVSPTSERPQPRLRGVRLELAEAATFIGIYDGGRYHQSGYAIDWQMIEIVAVDRKGWELFITGRLIEMADEPIVHFAVTCADDIIVVGDVVSGSFLSVSAFHTDRLEPRSYRVTWYESDRFRTIVSTGDHVLRPLRTHPPKPELVRDALGVATTLIRRRDLRRPKPKAPAVLPREAKAAKIKAPKERASKPKAKSANQVKREDMLAKLVVEHRRDRLSRSPKDEK
ncbi:hypothetical protein [Aminobacter carboxidus]|uniref:Uncharacterized protein n=1 Tax=Aminobacter carboxidus TaxID=376165 RepID=A0ABR9GJ69_9HYPH|nr:hypothetical protein [Aminobacter carboxidus]MBE1203688.1 hypothetical protein [Aminobacter carboxidus]